MLDLIVGDVCICDLSLSINAHKYVAVPLVFISCQTENGFPVYTFCRIGRAPVAFSRHPFVAVAASSCLRKRSAVYPTQTVMFSDELGIIKRTGCLLPGEIQKVMEVRQKKKKEGSVALVMTLCPRCRRNFLMDPTSIVKRMDPFAVQESQCDFCQVRNGHTYVIFKRKIIEGTKE